MFMLQIAVCDDNIDELSNMVQLINLYRTSKNFSCEYAVFPNGFELVSALVKGKRFDIYCLDIIMPGFTGIDVAKEIRGFDKIAPILFFTSSPEFALESYSVKAIQASKNITGSNERCIKLRVYSKNNKLCIDIRNRYQTEPIFHQGLPVSKEQGHGFGTKSMSYVVEKHGGVYQFLLKDGWFIFQATA